MITIKDLKFAYKKSSGLLNQLNLELMPGRIYGLLGKNGAGKTTLLHLMAGLQFPQEGTLSVMNYTPGKRQVDFLRNIFLLPEEFYIPDITISEYARRTGWFYPAYDGQAFLNYLEEMDVDPASKFKNLSMGQRKKAYIAFAVACNTPVLFMDEPTNGLDIPSKSQFRRLMASVVQEDRCIIISTHQVRDLENLIDSVLVLDGERIVFDRDLESISENLSFETVSAGKALPETIYEESGLLSGKAVTRNLTGKPSHVDMELLFDAIMFDSEKIESVFTLKPVSHE